MKNKTDEFKKLEEEMVEKGSSVTTTERPAPPSADDIEKALARHEIERERNEDPTFVSPEEQAASKKKKKRIILIVVLFLVLAALGAGGFIAWRMLGPSTAQADLNEEFNLGEDEVALIIDGVRSEEKGRVIDGQTYIPEKIATSYMDERIYVDTKEKILSYATEEGVTDYAVDEEKDGEKPLKEEGGSFYISLSFIAKNASCEYTEYDSPKRIAIFADHTKNYTVATIGKEERMRKGPGNKYPYFLDLKEGDEVFISMDRKQENEYQPVVTKDGISGYVTNESIRKTESKTLEFSKEPTSFTQKSIDATVCLGWHNIGSEHISSLPLNTKESKTLNILAPTWYVVKNNKGGISSIADKDYVKAAHDAGLKVWPTVRDFPSKKLKLQTALGRTTTRRKLIDNLIDEAKTYGFDGINVDFERVKAKAAKAYLQFLRELTIEAHKENLIISSDNYPIREYNSYYNPAEQGRIVDYVIFMAYDEHYSGSEEAGSVSSLLYVQDAIAKAVQRVPKERVVVGLPFFTRLWLESTEGDDLKLTSEVLTMSDAENWVWSKGAKAKWDKELGQQYAELKEGKDKIYKLWMENERSLKKKLAEVKKQEIAGAAFWSMGSERAITWETIDKSLK